jgi:hypothetical protein
MLFHWPENVSRWLKKHMAEKKYPGYETSDTEEAKRWHEGIVVQLARDHHVPMTIWRASGESSLVAYQN